MERKQPRPIAISDEVSSLTFLPDRTPTTSAAKSEGAFKQLSAYRDGGIFVGHWAGTSEWERHSAGDEIVLVLDGETTIFFGTGDAEESAHLHRGDLVVVPRGTWHRFVTSSFVKLMSVTPQPTDHSADEPDR